MKKSNILDNLVKNKRLPILFIGSGFSKRYVNNYPTWMQMLDNIALQIGLKKVQIEAYIQKIKAQNHNATDNVINAKYASLLSSMLRDKIISNELDIEKFLDSDELKLYLQGCDCFKLLISKKFKSLELREEKEEELELLKTARNKISSVLTTNYDDLLNSRIFVDSDVFVFQDDLYFHDHTNYAEIYKLHGDINNPNTIIVTEEDYDGFFSNLKLLTAKVMTLLCDFPVIFLGYSLSDDNIKKIFYDFISSFGADVRVRCKDKFIFVQYQEGQEDLIEGEKVFQYEGADITVKTITTDNYADIYKYINEISPSYSSVQLREIKKQLKYLLIESEKGQNKVFDNVQNGTQASGIMFQYNKTIGENSIGVRHSLEGFAENPDDLNLLIFKREKVDYDQYASYWFNMTRQQEKRHVSVFTIKCNLSSSAEISDKFEANYAYRKNQFDEMILNEGMTFNNDDSSMLDDLKKEIDQNTKNELNKLTATCQHILDNRLKNKITNENCRFLINYIIEKNGNIIRYTQMRKLMVFYDYLVNYEELN